MNTNGPPSVDIVACPFCGKRLTITTTSQKFIDFIKSEESINYESGIGKVLLLILESEISVFNTSDINITNMLTKKYGTEVEAITKNENIVHVYFKEPKYNGIEGNNI